MPEGTPPLQNGKKFPNKGQLFPDLRPRKCSNCPEQVSIDKRAIYLDTRVFTENGWMPYVDPEEKKHWYWIFCSLPCLLAFVSRVKEKGDLLGLK
jgi:hypothetical protein